MNQEGGAHNRDSGREGAQLPSGKRPAGHASYHTTVVRTHPAPPPPKQVGPTDCDALGAPNLLGGAAPPYGGRSLFNRETVTRAANGRGWSFPNASHLSEPALLRCRRWTRSAPV